MDTLNNPSVQFRDEEVSRAAPASLVPSGGIIAWVMKHSGGSLKNEKQASIAIIVFIVLALCFSAFLLFAGSPAPKKAPAVLIQMMPVNQ